MEVRCSELAQRLDLAQLEAGPHVDEPPRMDEWNTSQRLSPTLVAAARAEEMTFLRSLDTYIYDEINTCVEKTGRQPVGVKW
eukprot:5445922-Amphidinium_carterae.1